MADGLRRIAGVRLGIAIQVFTTLLILAVGYLVIEGSLRDLAMSPRPVTSYQIRNALLEIRSKVLLVASVAFISGVALTWTIRRELKRAIDQVQRISRGVMEPTLPGDLTQEFVPLNTAIRELAESVGRFLRRSVTDAIVLVTEDLKVELLNPTAELLFGYTTEEVKGKPLSLLFPEHSGNQELHRWLREEGEEQGNSSPGFGTILNKAGEWIPVRLGLFRVGLEQGHLRGIVAGVFDEAEWERIRWEFQRAERLSNLGLLVSALAHEIKNPLGSVHGLVQLLKDEFPPGHAKRAYVETILKEVARLDGIMKRLLDLSSQARWRRESLELGGMLLEVGTLMEGEASARSVRLRKVDSSGEVLVSADPERLRQALINVMKNAIEATVQGGEVSYGMEVKGQWACIWVENPAPTPWLGQPEGAKPAWVWPGKSGGSGLGLLITQHILQYHGGRLEVEGPRDGKILVRLKLPREEQKSQSPLDEAAQKGETP